MRSLRLIAEEKMITLRIVCHFIEGNHAYL
jgi:hypothetical protein